LADLDPFRHHPGLKALIGDPEQSFFRTLDLAEIDRLFAANGAPEGLRTPDALREAERLGFLAALEPGDLWVFGYGSLMWDPAFRFVEVRRARVEGQARRAILKDVHGGRGTAERPGLFVALDAAPGEGCDGLAFRIAAEAVEAESFILWRRERIAPAYRPAMVAAGTAQGTVRALTFVADHAAEPIEPGLSFESQVDYCATGTGFLGSTLDYLRGIVTHLAELDIEDAALSHLVTAAEARAAA
jgi:glutathione-specific gamma-glutamylcyclotransferase